MKSTYGGVLLLVKLQALTCNCTKCNTSLWVFFTFFKFYKWYQIVQSVSYGLRIMASIANYFKVKFDSEKKFLNTNTKFVTQDIKFRFTGVNTLWIYSELY